jgi:hypothetical protein
MVLPNFSFIIVLKIPLNYSITKPLGLAPFLKRERYALGYLNGLPQMYFYYDRMNNTYVTTVHYVRKSQHVSKGHCA